MAKESGRKLSDYFEIDDEYAAFCLDELGLYLSTVWRNEKPYKQKVIEQNRGLMSKADKLKSNTQRLMQRKKK